MASIANKSDLVKFISDIVKPLGFTKKRDNWYCRTDDCIGVLGLDKSPYGGKFYLNIGIWMTHLDGTVDYPQSYQCHIQTRVDRLVPDRDALLRALDLSGEGMATEERCSLIEQAITAAAVPTLRLLSTTDGIRTWLANTDTSNWLVFLTVKKFFGIPIES